MPKGVREHWNEEMVTRAVGMKRAGIPNKDIAERLGVSISSVIVQMRKMKAKRRLDGHGGSRGMFAHKLSLDAIGVIIDQRAGIED